MHCKNNFLIHFVDFENTDIHRYSTFCEVNDFFFFLSVEQKFSIQILTEN